MAMSSSPAKFVVGAGEAMSSMRPAWKPACGASPRSSGCSMSSSPSFSFWMRGRIGGRAMLRRRASWRARSVMFTTAVRSTGTAVIATVRSTRGGPLASPCRVDAAIATSAHNDMIPKPSKTPINSDFGDMSTS